MILRGGHEAGSGDKLEPHEQPQGTTPFLNRSRSVVLGLIAVVVIVVVILVLTGQLVVRTEDVTLGKLAPSTGSGDIYYTAQFDGPIRNASPSEAKQGTAQVSMSLRDPGPGQNLEILFQLWHAEQTGIKNLQVTLTTPNDWGGLLFSLPEGDGWGPMLHKTIAGSVAVEFTKMGGNAHGYVGTIWLRFYPEFPEYVLANSAGDSIHADVQFDMAPTSFPRFRQWHVHGSWEIPVTALEATG
jgi:hypothetical protein